MTIAYLSLGSNVGDRLTFLMEAESKLADTPKIKVLNRSKVYETEPWFPDGRKTGQPAAEEGHAWYLNRVLEIETALTPVDLLYACQMIEKEMGRTHKKELKPRKIDIDILLYGGEIVDLPELQVPHRHMADRQFILVPLTEMEPNLKDPVTKNLYSYILKNLKDTHKVTPFL